MKKFIVVVIIAVIAWIIFIKKPAILSTLFLQKDGGEQIVISSGLGGQLFEETSKANPFGKNLNPYEEAYVNPFK